MAFKTIQEIKKGFVFFQDFVSFAREGRVKGAKKGIEKFMV